MLADEKKDEVRDILVIDIVIDNVIIVTLSLQSPLAPTRPPPPPRFLYTPPTHPPLVFFS